MDNPNLTTTVSPPGFLPTTSTNNSVMPFTPPLPSVPMPQFMLWTPMQQPPLVVPVTPLVVSAPPRFNRQVSHNYFCPPTPSEPIITVFVGNIADKAPSSMIRQILATCGNIASWKTVQGFCFCKYYGAEAAIRATKILHDIEVGGKKLVVKVDEKAQEALDQFKVEKKDAYDSKENQEFEFFCRQIITNIITEYNDELSKEEEQNEDKQKPNIEESVGFDLVPNEDEKQNIIDREIRKFRKLKKKQDEENEVERKKKEEKEKLIGRHGTPDSSDSAEIIRINCREEQEKRDNEKEVSDKRERKRNEKEKREREKKERRDKEIEEEELEAKEEEKKRREREISYQEKCKQWEIRENQKKKERSLERYKNQMKKEKREKNAKKLKQFLEDYDDEKDDEMYYKGIELQKRIEHRKKELEKDQRNQQNEKNELEAIRKKIYSCDFKDPELEFNKVLKGIEEMYKPELLIDVAKNQKDKFKPFAFESEKEILKKRNLKVEQKRQRYVMEKAVIPSLQQLTTPPLIGPQTIPPEITPMTQTTILMIKKRRDMRDVFNNDDEEVPRSKTRKLVPLDYTDIKKEDSKSVEERNKTIRQLIERIPTTKDDLFSLKIDWSVVDNQLLEKRIRPWINKKMIEYIGGPEPALVDFICSKILSGSTPQAILDEVQMVLDEEAEMFVVKIWRFLVYEVEAKKLGLVKFEENGHKNP